VTVDKHLFHELVKKVLLFWVEAFGHDLFIIVDERRKHLLVDGRAPASALRPPGPSITLKLLHPGRLAPDLLVELINI